MKHYLISVLILSMLNFDVHSMKRKRQKEVEAFKGAQQHIVETKRPKPEDVIEEPEQDLALIVKNPINKLQLLDLPNNLLCYIFNKLLPDLNRSALEIMVKLGAAIEFMSSSKALRQTLEGEMIKHIRDNIHDYENIRDYCGDNILGLAVSQDNYQVACIMLKAFNNMQELLNDMIKTDYFNYNSPIHLYKLFFWLMCNGHKEIADLIWEHISINMQDLLFQSRWKELSFDGKSAFHAAVDNSSFECIAKMLLSWDADVNAQDVNGHTALTYAIKRENLDIIKILITWNANPNISDNTHLDLNPFLQAIISGNPEIIKLLIPYVSDINGKNEFGLTPLLCAKLALIGRENYAEITNILKENGALEADFENCDKVTMLILAIDKNWLSGIKLLIEQGASPRCSYYHSCADMQPLDYAVHINNFDAAKLLIDNYNPGLSEFTLGFSVKNNNMQMFELIFTYYQSKVKNEQEEEEFIGDFSTALSDALEYAILNKNLVFIKRLIELSYMVEFSDEDNPLNVAIEIPDLNKQLEIMEFLIKHGADVNRPCSDGIIPLHNAVELECPSAVNLLLKNGADIYLINGFNQTVFDLGCNNKQINLLLKEAETNYVSK